MLSLFKILNPGPNSWPQAREAILKVNERIKAPFSTRSVDGNDLDY